MSSEDLVLYHSTEMGEVTGDQLRAVSGYKVLLYSFLEDETVFAPYSDLKSQKARESLSRSRQKLKELVPFFDQIIVESEQARADLKTLGLGDWISGQVSSLASSLSSKVLLKLPFTLIEALDASDWERVSADPLLKEFLGGRAAKLGDRITLLTSAPIDPTQRLEDVIRLFSWYRKEINGNSRLVVMGPVISEDYVSILKSLSAQMCGRSGVIFGTDYSLAEKKASYEVADLMISLAEREGMRPEFLDAAVFGIPVLTFASETSKEFWGDAGVFAGGRDLPILAEFVDVLVRDQALRGQVVRKQKERVDWIRSRLGRVLNLADRVSPE